MRYSVVTIKWSKEQCKQVKTVVGIFDSYVNAELFKVAYEERYHAFTEIVDVLQNIQG